MIDFGDGREERLDAIEYHSDLKVKQFLGTTHKYCHICHGYGFTIPVLGGWKSNTLCLECGGSGKIRKEKND